MLFLINNNLLFFCADNAAANNTAFPPGDIPPGHAGNWVSSILCAPPTFRTGQFFENREVFGKTFEKIGPFENSKNNIKKDYNGGLKNDSS